MVIRLHCTYTVQRLGAEFTGYPQTTCTKLLASFLGLFYHRQSLNDTQTHCEYIVTNDVR